MLDEPEAALSPKRQLSFLIILHEMLTKEVETQFIIATHSPILLAYPGAQILSFDNRIIEIAYEDTSSYQTTNQFLQNPTYYLNHLLK